MHQLGEVEQQRLQEAVKAKESPEELLVHFPAAVGWYNQALERIPQHLSAPTYNRLGSIYGDIGDLDTALPYYRESIRCTEARGDSFGAGRFNVAIDLSRAARFAEALEWARAALRDYEASENADPEIIQTTELIRQIESDLSKAPPPQ